MKTQVTSASHRKAEEEKRGLSLSVLSMAPEGAVIEM